MATDRQSPDRQAHPVGAAGAPAERLNRFLCARLELLASRLPSDGAPLDDGLANEVRTLESLSNLTREHLRVESPKRRSLLPMALLIATAAVITSLVFIPLGLVRVEMDVVCSAVTFRTARAVQLTGLSSLKLLQGVVFAPTQIEEPMNLRTFDLMPPVELRPRDDGSVTLGSITIPADTAVSIEKMADQGTWRLQIASSEAMIAATLAGSVDTSAAGSAPETINFGRGVTVALEASPSTASVLEIHVTPSDAGSFLVRRTIPLTEVSFEEVVEEPTPENVGVIRGRASSVVEGRIFNESLGGRQSSLRNREVVEVSLVDGQMREIQLDQSSLHVNLSASARELRIGSSGAMQSLRPSYLEWLAEYHALKLAWGSAAWLFALVLGGVKWWQQ